jgi:hypothetical protein
MLVSGQLSGAAKSLDKIKINPILIKTLFISVLIICPEADAGGDPWV